MITTLLHNLSGSGLRPWTPECHFHGLPCGESCMCCCGRNLPHGSMFALDGRDGCYCCLCANLTPSVESIFRNIAALVPTDGQPPNNMVYNGLRTIKMGGRTVFSPGVLLRIATFHLGTQIKMRTGTILVQLIRIMHRNYYEFVSVSPTMFKALIKQKKRCLRYLVPLPSTPVH
jgi:hypothetical protein